MNAKRKWDMKTILLGLIIAVIAIAVVFVIFTPSAEDAEEAPLKVTVQGISQNKGTYVGKRIVVEGFYYSALDDPCLIPATTVSNPNPTIWINLDEASLNLAKQAADITVSDNLKYRVVGVLEKVDLPIGFDVKIIVESIEAV
jgi:flagellar basal body-associated protein FliL